MFAYRHAFHAGNHADVLKHALLVSAVDLLQQKEGPILFIDTHAGAGCYTLKSSLVRDKAEWGTGIGRLWQSDSLPESLRHYYETVAQFNKGRQLTHYPGSAVILNTLLRDQDRLRAFELHPSDIAPLQRSLKGKPRQVKAERKDGFQQLRALLPPPDRRALILIDPPYELRTDYALTIGAVREGLGRFSTGTYMIWIPQIARFQVDRMLRQLAGLGVANTLMVSLTVRAPGTDGLGLQGSSLVVLNPPYGLEQAAQSFMPFLARTLGQDRKASCLIKTALGPTRPSAVRSPERSRSALRQT